MLVAEPKDKTILWVGGNVGFKVKYSTVRETFISQILLSTFAVLIKLNVAQLQI